MALDSSYYQQTIDLSKPHLVEQELQALLDQSIASVDELKQWLESEARLSDRIDEVFSGHRVDFFRDTDNQERKERFIHDQQQIAPLVERFGALYNQKFCDCPYTKELDDERYGLMKKVRATDLELYREENISLQVNEGELVTEYQGGRYATETGCYRNGIPLASDSETVARLFKEAGYATAYIGKWHLASGDPVPQDERGGYEYWLAANTLEFTSDAYRTELYDHDGNLIRLPGYRVDALTDAAIRYMDRAANQQQPFFLFMSFLEPHHQNHRDDYPAPDGYASRYGTGWIPPDLMSLKSSDAEHLPG